MSRKALDLFTPVVANGKAHVAFERLKKSPVHWAARNLMDDLYRRMGDPDGNFVKDFQSDGFHSRLFEIACYAYLEAQGLKIDRSFSRPDFLVSRDGSKVAVEAVTSNPSSGRATDIAVMSVEKKLPHEMVDKCDHEFPIRIGSILFDKLKKRYWELEHCEGLPFVLVVGPFHEPGSTAYVDDSLARYLYGVQNFDDWTERNGVLVRGEVRVKSHEFKGKSIPSSFFDQPMAENVSAVLYCNQFGCGSFTTTAFP